MVHYELVVSTVLVEWLTGDNFTCVLGIQLAEVSTLPREIVTDAKHICQQISDQQKVSSGCIACKA